jgi:hypothetical protein
MIDIFKKDVNIGDKVKLYLTTGKEPIGIVLEIGNNHLLLQNEEGNTARIFEVLIGGWDIISAPTTAIVHKTIPKEDIKNPIEEQLDGNKDTQNTDITLNKISDNIDYQEKDKPIENLLVEDIKESETKEIAEVERFSPKKIGVKIVGQISLDNFVSNKVRFPNGRTYRLREVSKDFDLSISDIVEIVKNSGISIDENNPNFRIDQVAYDLIKSEKNNKKETTQENKISTINENEKNKSNNGLKLNSLSDLSKLKEKIEIDISQQMLPANAKIKRYSSRHQYGFLTDKDGLDYHFKFSEVKDDILLEKLNDFGVDNIQVICQLNNFNGNHIAKNLNLPKAVESFQKKAELFFENGKENEAIELINLILINFPDYSQAVEFKRKIEYQNKRKNKSNYSESRFNESSGYRNKNTEILKVKFIQSIKKNDQGSEKAIKGLANLLMSEGKFDDAIELIINNASKIKSTDPNSFIAYFYEAKKDYKTAIEYLNKIISKSQLEDLKLAKRLALSYVGIGEYEIAELQINKVLKIRPNDEVANKLKEVVLLAKEKGSEEVIDLIFKEAEISALTGGLSQYLLTKLEQCEFSGVPRSEIDKGNFTKKTLSDLKKYTATIKDGRPKERADAYLSQAKIEQILDSENTSMINSPLAKYCTSIAMSWAADGKQIDSFRNFIREAAALEPENYDNVGFLIPSYLHSFSIPIIALKSKMRQSFVLAMEEVIPNNRSNLFWFGVLDLLLVNSAFSTRFLTLLFKNENYRSVSLVFLKSFIEFDKNAELNSDKFLDLWMKAREKYKREKDNFKAKLSALLQSNTLESLVESFFKIKDNNPEWLGQLDKQTLVTLKEVIETVIEFNKQKSYEDKERYFNVIVTQLSQLKDDIQNSPTEISFNSFIPIIDFTSNLIIKAFKDVIETSKPILSIQVLGEGSIDDNTGNVIAQFAVSNKTGSAPVSYLKVVILNDDYIEFVEENNIIEQNLKGGDEQILKLKLKVKNKIIEEGATNIKIAYTYKIRGNEKEFKQDEELTLRFYSSADFEKIENVFATNADGGPVQNSSMFFGRDEFISNIKDSITNSKSKCVIIYGQKRSGKSSVLHHLRESLNNSPNTFCISFSLGEILEDLSPKTFYYTILSEIEDTLYTYAENNENVPQYSAPEYKELDDVPTLLFNNQIKLLNREFKKYPNWSNKKLVLLIDEFTYIYTAIKKEHLSEQFMKTWKSFLEKGFFNSVLIGQDIMPKFKASYPNEFGVTEDKRLSYLKKSDAVALIEKPIWDNTRNRSRFLGKATDLILDYTSSNPYYVQIFCSRLVDYMNDKKALSITEADVIDIANSFIKGEQALDQDKFDNLITAGDADLDAFNSTDVLTALKTIAIASKNLDSCPREAINLGEIDYEERILKDLKDREVLSIPLPGYFKINVRLFKEWLLIN